MLKNKWTLMILLSLTCSSFSYPVFASNWFNSSQITATQCSPPVNIDYMITPDRKQITFGWQPHPRYDNVLYFQVNDAKNMPLKKTKDKKDKCTTVTHSGKKGRFVFYFYSQCESGLSAPYKFQVIVK